MAIRWEDLPGDRSYAAYLQKARARFEKGEAATVAELRKVYRRAAIAIRKDIEKATPGTLRRAHMEALAKNLDARARELNKDILAAAHKGIWLSTETGTEGAAKISEQLLKDAFDAADVRRLFAGINERAALAVLSRTGKDGLKLSDRIWRTSEKWRNAARRVVEDGVARGLSARKLAKEVEKYLQPGVWTALKAETRRRLGVSKDVSMEGMRLAVTEMQNAFHEGTIMANRAAPSYQGVYWRLSASHPIPDVCDDYASHGGSGYWPAGQEPSKPHPWCRCFLVPAHEPPEQFAERLKNWIKNPAIDTKLEMWYNTTVKQYLKRPSLISPVVPAVRETVLFKAVKEKEAEIAGLDYERAYVFDNQGNVILNKKGTRDRVEFLPSEIDLIKDKDFVFTHNHPLVGGSFSLDDIQFAAAYNFAEARAVGAEYAHSMKRAKQGWPEVDTLVNEYNNAEKTVRSEFWHKITLGQMTRDEANKEHHHQVWLRVAAKLNLSYRREKRIE
jgi:hypothetical protein